MRAVQEFGNYLTSVIKEQLYRVRTQNSLTKRLRNGQTSPTSSRDCTFHISQRSRLCRNNPVAVSIFHAFPIYLPFGCSRNIRHCSNSKKVGYSFWGLQGEVQLVPNELVLPIGSADIISIMRLGSWYVRGSNLQQLLNLTCVDQQHRPRKHRQLNKTTSEYLNRFRVCNINLGCRGQRAFWLPCQAWIH